MPTSKAHKAKASYNEKFFDDVKDSYQDWALTGLFYSALHLVDAFLSSKGISVENHLTRADFINKIKELKPLYQDYRILYDYSVNARYKMHSFSTENISDTYKNIFQPFKKAILKHI
jgi:uncharacterized protein (UPF0332 family)